MEIPHKDYYGFNERVAVRDDPSATDALSINQAYRRFYQRLVVSDSAWETPAAYVEMPRVYIASTVHDLQLHRTAVRDAAAACGLQVVSVEDLGAAEARPLSECLANVESCDLLVALTAHRYGLVPAEQADSGFKSITWLECEAAIQKGEEILAFTVDENYAWPAELREAYQLSAAAESGTINLELVETCTRNVRKLQEFKNWLRGNATRSFTTPESLYSLALQAFRVWREEGILSMGFQSTRPTKTIN